MLITTPAEEPLDPVSPRSGHGAASVIPHMNHERQRHQHVDDAELEVLIGQKMATDDQRPSAGLASVAETGPLPPVDSTPAE